MKKKVVRCACSSKLALIWDFRVNQIKFYILSPSIHLMIVWSDVGLIISLLTNDFYIKFTNRFEHEFIDIVLMVPKSDSSYDDSDSSRFFFRRSTRSSEHFKYNWISGPYCHYLWINEWIIDVSKESWSGVQNALHSS